MKWLVFPALVVATLVAVGLGLIVGPGDLHDPDVRSTLLELRASRIVVAFLVGSSLSVAGVLVQGLFRNPLASPSILGTTAGASLGGQLALLGTTFVLGSRFSSIEPELVLPLGCLLGALGALGILLLAVRKEAELVTLLLVGFLLSSLFLSVGAFLTSLAQESWELGRAVIAFTLGSVSGAGVRQILLVAPLAVGGVVAAWSWGRSLDLMLSGEEEATSLGLDAGTTRRWAIIWAAVLTGAAVAAGGNVGFVGLIVPHVMRRFVGVRHRPLVLAVAWAGGVFVVACDTLSRAIPGQSEVPLGVITGLVGAPLFLTLLIRSRRGSAYA
jgi:iron complex transport system permease protein